MTKTKPIYQIKAEEMMISLGFDPKTGKPASEKRLRELKGKLQGNINSASTDSFYHSPNSSLNKFPTPPFRIKVLEKTHRQSPHGKAYLYSAVYRNAVTLRLMVKIFTSGLDRKRYGYLISQMESEARSIVANIREGYLRPTSGEMSVFLGYSQGSLEELRGDIIDAKDDGLLPSHSGSSLRSLNISLKPPTDISPKSYLEDIKRKIGEIKTSDLTYEIFLELINKTDWLLKRAVLGIDRKIVIDETEKLSSEINAHWSKVW